MHFPRRLFSMAESSPWSSNPVETPPKSREVQAALSGHVAALSQNRKGSEIMENARTPRTSMIFVLFGATGDLADGWSCPPSTAWPSPVFFPRTGG